jgi:hypothetical protein
MPSKIDKAVIGTSVASGAVTIVGAGGTALGFSSSGIVGGSVAAGMQAGIGNVVAGSTFATMQSLGALGVLSTVGVVGGVGLVAGGGYLAYKLIKKTRL